MRTPGGKRLTREQWRSLEETELSAAKPDVPIGWYHTCYCWSVIAMASFLLARQSADKARQTLYYVQAIDEPIGLAPTFNTPEFHQVVAGAQYFANQKAAWRHALSPFYARAVHDHNSAALRRARC